MELKFLGTGSAFNIERGNTAAYYKDLNKNMFLIDCGEDVFAKLKKHNILDGVNNLYVFITHLHPDHAGSLGSLCFYNYHIRKQKAMIVLPGEKHKDYVEMIKQFLSLVGVSEKHVEFITEPVLTDEFEYIRYVKVEHSHSVLSYGIEMCHVNDGVTFYSGDTNDTVYIKQLIENTKNIHMPVKLDIIYVDTCMAEYAGNVHLNYKLLKKAVPKEFRNKVYCMHIDDDSVISTLKQIGFNVAQNSL